MSFDNTQSIIHAVIHGLGISVVSEVAARDAVERNAVVPLKLDVRLPERRFYYVQKKHVSHSHLVDVFVAFLEREWV